MLGNNGEGKSNLLEAVELLASLRSHRCSQDRDLIQRGESSSRLKAWVGDEAGDELAIELRRQGGRRVQRNGKLLERHADLIGPLRCVGFSALDLSLVRGEPSGRRDWLDRVVQQLEPVYGELLSRHGRLLRQRSQLLKRQLSNCDELLDAFDQQLAVIGTRLHPRRHRALKRLEPLAAPWQERLSGGRERLQLHYQPGTQLDGDEDPVFELPVASQAPGVMVLMDLGVDGAGHLGPGRLLDLGSPGKAGADVAPDAGHLVHMPSHIYWRVGRYDDALEINRRAAASDEAFFATCRAGPFYRAEEDHQCYLAKRGRSSCASTIRE